MTQIKKTLSIAGIIALVTMPVMADIASTDYVQNIVNSIPQPAAATASSAGLTKLYTGVGTNTDGTMTQKAITDALDAKLGNNATDGSIAIGSGTTATGSVDDDVFYGSLAIGNGAKASDVGTLALGGSSGWGGGATATGGYSIAIGSDAHATKQRAISIGIGTNTTANYTIALGDESAASGNGAMAVGSSAGAYASNSTAIGANAIVDSDGENAIQLGEGTNDVPRTFNVGFGSNKNYTLLDSNGIIPAERLNLEMGTISNNATLAIGSAARASANSAIAIGSSAEASQYDAIAIGSDAYARARYSIVLGHGFNNVPNSFAVGLGEGEEGLLQYTLLGPGGVIPAGRLTGGTYDEDEDTFTANNGTRGQLLSSNGNGTMSWVDATASVLPELINDCKVSGQRCVLITTWNSTTNKPEYTWEVVKVNNN